MLKSLLAVSLAGVLFQTASSPVDLATFRKQREAEIGGETGWAALTGLHWLTNGSTTVGRDARSGVVLAAPSAPARLGTLDVNGTSVTLRVAPGVQARVKGQPVTEVQLRPNTPASDGVTVGGMTMVVIERGRGMALRVWDRAAPGRVAFKGLRWYAPDPKLAVDATFAPHQPAGRVKIQNIIGETIEMANPGVVSFSIGGKTYRLEALLESDDANELFFMFRDGTSSKTTYGAGRYLYTPLPKDGHVAIDFNRATNPPCAFTNFATCPLPPAPNRLTVPIPAGELDHIH
jgi:uncharacterized protein (DUF1684 family)